MAEVYELQANWAGAITRISRAYLDKGDYVATAAEAAGELYGYGHGSVLFKPTKAAEVPFRPTANGAMSYFVGGAAAEQVGAARPPRNAPSAVSSRCLRHLPAATRPLAPSSLADTRAALQGARRGRRFRDQRGQRMEQSRVREPRD